MKLKLPEGRIIAPWKTRIISLMQTTHTEGITVEDILRVFPTAPKEYIQKAMEELAKENIAEDLDVKRPS